MINYPNKKKSANHFVNSSSINRGMGLEKDLNDSCLYYKECDRALIYKKPTPIQVVKVDYPNRNHAKICEAYYKTPSTTDYNGIYRGHYIDFEAKETRSKTAFSLKNIHVHQIEHLKRVQKHGGIAFLIIRFTTLNETYLLDASYMIEAYETKDKKSITYALIHEKGFLIKEGFSPRLKYLDVVDHIYFKED
ncbi:MAG: Holliday junction resolvase RecU [Erysipelotrichia bacterium]|nr:Holliday junction resolvase RecU [Erysipelotrichia bacterium]NCC55360.1 Holliday junction resolvase RecU [Erysipelotrichia bacterium]